jgi:hypothetical protein
MSNKDRFPIVLSDEGSIRGAKYLVEVSRRADLGDELYPMLLKQPEKLEDEPVRSLSPIASYALMAIIARVAGGNIKLPENEAMSQWIDEMRERYGEEYRRPGAQPNPEISDSDWKVPTQQPRGRKSQPPTRLTLKADQSPR